ncbi:MAG: PAS domain-containing protein [Nitratireductor sp.]|nr:PAS domain-containing protein [Nitratireductor sp.]
MQAAKLGIWDWDLVTNRFEYTSRAREIFGFSPDEEVTVEKLRDATHPDDLPMTSAQARAALDPEEKVNKPYEYRILRRGAVRWVRAHGEAVFTGSSGERRAVRYIGTIEDITQRKQDEAALAESARKLQLAIEIAGIAIWELKIADEMITRSPELNRMFGYEAGDEPSVEDYRSHFMPGERERLRLAGAEAMGAGKSKFEVEFRIRRRDGEVRWLLLRAEVLRNEKGDYDRVVGVLLDIDEQKRSLERQQLMTRELSHRVKNSLTVVQALAGQTFRDGQPVYKALEEFRGRLHALALANDILAKTEWREFPLRELILQVTAPYRGVSAFNPFEMEVGETVLNSRLSQPMALVLHELCTNAAKYGSLSVPGGRVSIHCREEPGRIVFDWTETGGPAVAGSQGGGFGTRLLTSILVHELGGLELRFDPDGLKCRIVIDLPGPSRPFAVANG